HTYGPRAKLLRSRNHDPSVAGPQIIDHLSGLDLRHFQHPVDHRLWCGNSWSEILCRSELLREPGEREHREQGEAKFAHGYCRGDAEAPALRANFDLTIRPTISAQEKNRSRGRVMVYSPPFRNFTALPMASRQGVVWGLRL